jgi:hypothetical protein
MVKPLSVYLSRFGRAPERAKSVAAGFNLRIVKPTRPPNPSADGLILRRFGPFRAGEQTARFPRALPPGYYLVLLQGAQNRRRMTVRQLTISVPPFPALGKNPCQNLISRVNPFPRWLRLQKTPV